MNCWSCRKEIPDVAIRCPHCEAEVEAEPTGDEMSLPKTPGEWLDEIRRAIEDARKSKPFGILAGQRITDADLFHMAPLAGMKFRGLNYRDERMRRKVTEGALANYVANSDPEGTDHGLDSKPLLAFAVCYVAAHYVLNLIDNREAETILDYCDEQEWISSET